MWKEALLQVLIACLPVFMFMVWYSKPERTYYTHIFVGIGCAMAMLLNMFFSTVNDHGSHFDLRLVPYLIGSLYGGIPIAVVLSTVYAATRLYEIANGWEYLYLFIGLSVFAPILFSRISVFHSCNRKSKFKIAAILCLILVVMQIAECAIGISGLAAVDKWEIVYVDLIFAILFVAVTFTCVHFTELSFERIRLQLQLHDVSMKYRNEVRRLQHFIDHAPLMVVFCDNKGRITHVNDLMLTFVAPLGRSDVLKQKFSLLLEKMDVQTESDPVARVLKGEEKLTEILKWNGRMLYTVYFQIKETLSKGTEGVLFIGHDVTELQRLKDEVDRMERLSLVGQMAASITHEIRNPMAVIRGFIQLLNERSPSDQKSYFRIVLDELDRANAIINDFLSLAQNRIVEKLPSSLNELLSDLLPLIWADANMRGQMVDIRLDENIDLFPMNSKEMKQLILNLSRNGMEAMNDKGVLRIETLNLPDSVQLRVIDSGTGIPPEKLERLFEPFYTTKANGTGLGLALCLSIVERHNGKIHVESEAGKGTTFIVSFFKPVYMYG